MIPTVDLPAKLVPVFDGPAMYRGAYGGRGSAKTRTFAKMSAVWGLKFAQANMPGVIVCGREFMNSLDESSLAEVKAAIASEPWLAEYYEVGEKYVRTKDGRIEYDFIGLRRNLDSIKSKSRIRLLWVDEAEPVSETAWAKAIPTVREDGAEIWVTWNPERKNSATHKRFRADPPGGAKIVEINWRDNPWFPDILNRTRLEDKAKRPDQYQHVWEGEFVTVADGAYYAASLNEAKAQGRICNLGRDPLMALRAFWDIGGTGARADACSIWIAQFIGREIRVLDYYEAQGQPLSAHIQWLRDRGYGKAECVLPHDGATNDRVHDVSFESALRGAGFAVTVIPNQGAGAAKMRIEAARRLFPSIWFNATATEAGRDALGWYHEKRSDDDRDIGLGPEHDWASHGCFHGHTEVLTRYGTQQIMNLPKTGEILTPCGWKPYILPRITKRAAPLVEVGFSGGHSVKCTPDHLFMTESGWRSAESLMPGTAILSTLTRSRSISMAASTVFGRVRSTCRAAARDFTATLGKLHSGQSLPGVISTTGTATCSTTNWTTLSACQPLSIYPKAGRNVPSQKMVGSQPQRGTRPLSGTHLPRAGFGISATQSDPSRGPNGSVKKSRASIAASFTWRWFERVATLASTARRLARSLLTGSAASQTNTLVVIESVRPLSETADVWDITVPDGNWFSLANGAVVHNSDAFGLMCVAYEKPRGKKPTRLEIPKVGVV